MKPIFVFAITAILYLTTTANAEPRYGQRPEAMCTSDINIWGHSSNCFCGDNESYDESSGFCLSGDQIKKVMVQGTITSGVMAIGGETTGFIIQTSEDNTYELMLKNTDKTKLAGLSGLFFEVEGELVIMEGIEIKERKIIIVERVSVLE